MEKKITKLEGMLAEHATKKLRVAAYCRVSTGSDKQLLSLETQNEHYESYIKGHPDWEFAGIYFDEGISGTKKEKRPALMRMMQDCEDGLIDHIITKSISRFSRNTTDCLELVRLLQEMNVSIYFEKENINSADMESELVLSILSGLAEDESASISKNNKWSIRHRFETGTYKISSPPYGYDYIGDGKWKINEEQAKWVRFIYSQALAGKGSLAIAKELDKLGVPTKRNAKWSSSSVRDVLTNEKYTGDCIFQKTYTDEFFNKRPNNGERDMFFMPDHHDAIVSHEDFDAVAALIKQRTLEKNIQKGVGKYNKRYPLSGKVVCGECGTKFKRRLNSSTKQRYHAWVCSRHLNDKASCSQKYIKEEDLQMAFVTVMNKMTYGCKDILLPLQKTLRALIQGEGKKRLKELGRLLDSNAEKKATLMNLSTKGYLDPAVYAKEIKIAQNEQLLYEEEMERINYAISDEKTKTSTLTDLIKFCSKGEIMTSFDGDCFTRFVDEVVIHGREKAVFQFKCGLSITERL